MAEIVIDLLPAADAALVAELTALINRVYAVAERGLWTDGVARTTGTELASLVAAGEIAVARLGSAAGPLVGAVRVRRLPGGQAEFGMLVAAPEHRGTGIGRELVRFAERWTLGQGLTTLRLELLVPRTATHPDKEFLRGWYTRLGFRPVRTGGIEDSYPFLAPLLAVPCDLVEYRKQLAAAAQPTR